MIPDPALEPLYAEEPREHVGHHITGNAGFVAGQLLTAWVRIHLGPLAIINDVNTLEGLFTVDGRAYQIPACCWRRLPEGWDR